MAVPFLVDQLGPTAALAIEVAWGADLSAPATTWVWSDITTDVRIKSGINLKHGRSDESGTTQPASCGFVLDNSTGAYSLGGQSPNWPNVKQNTPVRVRVDPANGFGYKVLFLGYADSWTPAWDQSANVATVDLVASGILRRLQQNTSPVLSSLRRRLTFESNVVAYWPMEEGRKATAASSALPGHPPVTIAGTVDFGADTTTFDSSVQSPVVKNGSLSAPLPVYAHTGEWQVRVLMGFPDQLLADQTVLLRIYTNSSSVSRIDLVYGTFMNGSGAIRVYNSAGTQVLASGFLDMDMLDAGARIYVTAEQVGSDVSFVWGRQDTRVAGSFGALPVVLNSATLGQVTRVEVFPNADVDGVAVGHLVVQDEVTGTLVDRRELVAFDEELTYIRFQRLCDENGIAHSEVGDGALSLDNTVTDEMGVQRPKDLPTLIRDLEAVDGGIVYDGVGNEGLTFFMRRAREDQAAAMSIPTSKLAAPLQPIDDDAARLNKAQVNREDGGDATFEDVDGPLGTANVGTYDASATVNVATDAAVQHYASWLVHKGTIEGYRYPSIELNFSATPELLPSWLAIGGPGRRIDITNPGLVAAGHPGGDLALEIQGYEQTIGSHSWTLSINCAPFDPWRVILLAATAGDTSEFVGRLDTDGSTLAAGVAVGATSLSVATTSGPIWTTVAEDFPLMIDVGGIVVEVTGISGTSSPQTFTVTGVTKALTSGLPVTVHNPNVLGL